MKNKTKIILPCLAIFLLIPSVNFVFAQEDTGSINLVIKYNTFDKINTYGSTLKVFQDNGPDPFLVIGYPETNPILIDELPLGHEYRIEVFVNGMFSGSKSVNLNGDKEMEILIPPAGGTVFNVLYSDNSTPAAGVTVSIFSDDTQLWIQDNTDSIGNTSRFWLQSNNAIDSYYFATVTIDERVTYEYPSKIKFFPEFQNEIKIILPWPETIEELMTISLYIDGKKVTKDDGKFVVELYNFDNKKIDQSTVSFRGDATFSNIKPGMYSFQALKIPEDPELLPEFWGVQTTPITGEVNNFKINKIEQPKGLEHTCNCVAFRLDDVQDFFLSDPQLGVFELFQSKEAPLSIGIIGGFIGTDAKIVEFIKNDIARSDPVLEIVSHSWNNSPLINYDKDGQKELLLKTDTRIFDVFGVAPRVMIPPENLINNSTFAAMEEIGYTHLTGHLETDVLPRPIINQTLYYVPANSETAKLNSETNLWDTQTNENILARIQDSLNTFGYAVVMMHPYEFALTDFGIYSNKRNQETLDQTSQLIDKVRQLGIEVVPMGKIHEQVLGVEKVEVVEKEEFDYFNCNCVAFRFVTLQDYWLSDIQTAVLNTFFIKDVPVTAGIIGNLFGYDKNLVEAITGPLEINDNSIEIANNGWNYEDFTSLTKDEQKSLIEQSNIQIASSVGKAPTVFIPPLEKFNDSTVSALKDNDIAYISSSIQKDPPPYQLNGTDFYHFPGGPAIGKYDPIRGAILGETHEETLEDINAYLERYGFAVVTLQPQEFSIVEKNSYTNSVNQQQIQELELLLDKIQDQGLKIIPISQIDEAISNPGLTKSVIQSDEIEEGCNCVAFSFATLQDYWLNDVQIEVIDTFIENDASVTIGVIGNLFGEDAKLVDYIKNTMQENPKSLDVANNGWDYEDFTSFPKGVQSSLIQQSNEKITSSVGKAPTVFIPPLEKFNDATVSALIENDITYISSSIQKDPPPYRLSGVNFYHFPWSSAIGQFDAESGVIVGSKHTTTLAEIELNIEEHDFAVVTMQPQEFSIVENGVYTNTVNQQQIQELKLLLAKIKALGYNIVLISDINQDGSGLSIPTWIKNNAEWWAEGAIDDGTFVQGIQYLINERIMIIPPTSQDSESESSEIPPWIKNNAGWWAEGLITDTDFVSGIQWLITNGVMKISV